jgi:hypothetical protein
MVDGFPFRPVELWLNGYVLTQSLGLFTVALFAPFLLPFLLPFLRPFSCLADNVL